MHPYRFTPLAVLLPPLLLGACNRPESGTTAAAPAKAMSAPEAMQPPAMDSDDANQVAFERPQTQTETRLAVSSPDLATQAPIDPAFTNYGSNRSPGLAWTAADGAQSYAIVLEDPDATLPQPFVHWVAWNLPATTTSLPHALPSDATLQAPAGMRQGRNGKQSTGYFGPRPPVGDPPHHYHFQVLALDRRLALPDDTDRNALVDAVAGHVIAKGELVATAEAPADAK